MLHQMLVGGAWVSARSGATTVATSPATGAEHGTVPEGDRQDAREAAAGL